jgi:DNA recombination protein RmuC
MEILLSIIVVALLAAIGGLLWYFLGRPAQGLSEPLTLIETIKEATRAASLEAAQSMSSKLLDDHKREGEAINKDAEARVQKVSEDLVKRVEAINQNVEQLAGQLQEKGRTLDTIWRALQSPTGAGYVAEIGLANTLASFGLEPGRDFVLQQTTQDEETGRRLRPDAVVFLPGNSVLVIDCKASKYLVEIARAEGAAEEETAYRNLARTMNQHLRSLAEKDYAGAIRAAWRDAGHDQEIARVLSVMYLPNEGALEKLNRADPDFIHRAREVQIIPAGPAGLHCAISLASVEISLLRQVENQKQIAEMTQSLVESVIVMLRHVGAVGRGLKSAADSFARLSGSANQRVLPRMRNLAKLGLKPSQAMPGNLPAFSVHAPSDMIEGEGEEVIEPVAELPLRPRLVE